MKRKSTLFIAFTTVLLLQISIDCFSQNQVYWRESFTPTSTVTGDPGVGSVPYTYVGDAGTWTMYGVWQTTGTSCVAEGTTGTGNRHIRSTSAVIDGGTTGTTEDDTAYMITPAVNYGINELHIYRSRNNRRLSIYTSTDALPSTTNWVLATVIPKSTASPLVLCTDTTIVLNNANAKQVRFRFERAGNSDVDSVVLTSVAAIPMPVNFIDVQASGKNGGVEIKWSTAEESDIIRYVIEQSTDAANFRQVGSIPAANRSSSYSWFDASPAPGVSYYRVKAIEYSGSKSTRILKVNMGKGQASMIIGSNPVKGNLLNLQLFGMEKGNYSLKLFNNSGQQIFQKNLVVDGVSLNQMVSIPVLRNGMYAVQLQGNSITLTKKVLVD